MKNCLKSIAVMIALTWTFSVRVKAQQVIDFTSHPIEVTDKNYRIVQVVDVRPDTSLIGVRRGSFARKRKITLAKPLSGFLYQAINSGKSSGSDTLVLQIRKFSIDDRKVGPSQYTTELKAGVTFFIKKGYNYYRLLDHDYTIVRNRATLEVRSENLSEFLSLSLSDAMAASHTVDLTRTFPLSWREVRMMQLPPIMFAEHYVRGVYMSEEEFRLNQPQYQNILFENDGSGRSPVMEVTDDNGNVKSINPPEYWGFSDGKAVYINAYGFCFRLLIDRKRVGFVGFDYERIQAKKKIAPTIGLIAVLALEVMVETKGSSKDKSLFRSNRGSIYGLANNIAISLSTANAIRSMEKPQYFKLFLDNGRFVPQDY